MDDIQNDPDTAFQEWPKIERFRKLTCTVSEKIDGTNAQILIPNDPQTEILAGSRSKWISPGKADNAGFAGWVSLHGETLRAALGPGRHYGEWYGAGIQRRYGLTEKRLALFSPLARYLQVHDDLGCHGDWLTRTLRGVGPVVYLDRLPQVHLVPVLYEGPLDTATIEHVVANLYKNGSVAVPGWMKPEGVVVSHARNKYKITDHGDVPKWQIQHAVVEWSDPDRPVQGSDGRPASDTLPEERR